jgi:hypothetical protein
MQSTSHSLDSHKGLGDSREEPVAQYQNGDDEVKELDREPLDALIDESLDEVQQGIGDGSDRFSPVELSIDFFRGECKEEVQHDILAFSSRMEDRFLAAEMDDCWIDLGIAVFAQANPDPNNNPGQMQRMRLSLAVNELHQVVLCTADDRRVFNHPVRLGSLDPEFFGHTGIGVPIIFKETTFPLVHVYGMKSLEVIAVTFPRSRGYRNLFSLYEFHIDLPEKEIMRPMRMRKCEYCAKRAPEGQWFDQCDKCHHAFYCSTACQIEAWKAFHFVLCPMIQCAKARARSFQDEAAKQAEEAKNQPPPPPPEQQVSNRGVDAFKAGASGQLSQNAQQRPPDRNDLINFLGIKDAKHLMQPLVAGNSGNAKATSVEDFTAMMDQVD